MKPTTVHMRRYLAAVFRETSLRRFGVSYDSVRKALVARGLLERVRIGGPTSTRAVYRLTDEGRALAAAMPRCGACEGRGHAGGTWGAGAVECAVCGGIGLDVEVEP